MLACSAGQRTALGLPERRFRLPAWPGGLRFRESAQGMGRAAETMNCPALITPP